MRYNDADLLLNMFIAKPPYTVRFWNKANEVISVGGKYLHDFPTIEDAWDGANALLESAYNLGAVEAEINDDFYKIIND